MKRRRGFTYIEIVIVTAMMFILASIALSAYGVYAARSRRVEVMVMGRHVVDMLTARQLQPQTHLPADNEQVVTFAGGAGVYGWAEVDSFEKKEWKNLGVTFDGNQRYAYSVQYWQLSYPGADGGNIIIIEATAAGGADIDGDPTPDRWLLTNEDGFTATIVVDDLAD